MSHQSYRTLVLVGDGIYADIATCYLANQLRSVGVNLTRVRGLSAQGNQTPTIDVDHSIHALNEELGIDFAALMSAGALIPKLVSTVSAAAKNIYVESYSYLKDDLPIPHYQVMARLISEGVTTQWDSASPLVALHHAGKFHPELHQFYRGNVRPYGGRVNVDAYSKILNAKSLSLGVTFLDASNIGVDVNEVDVNHCQREQNISALYLDADTVLKNAFFIDMTPEQRLTGLIAKPETVNSEAKHCGLNYSTQPWLGNCLAMGEAAVSLALTSAPVNHFDGLFKALVRFVDFFPCPARQDIVAKEYNRLQTIDNLAVADFLQTYHVLIAGNGREFLPEKLQHRVNLFAESCQLSEDAANWAYPNYWPTLMIAAGITPQYLPRRVQEVPLKYLMGWYNQRLQNIGNMVSRSRSL